VLEDGKVRLVRDIAGFNIRIARECKDVGLPLLPALWDPAADRLHQTLIVSPPQQGKTTLIRDLARLISLGGWGAPPDAQAGRKVGIVDERSEIAACVKGVPTFDVGPRTDVLDGCPKAEGMMMLIRSMSPDVLVVDEVGRPADAEAIREALHAGIAVIATAHGRDADDVRQRPALRELLESRVFTRIVALRRSGNGGLQLAVCGADGRPLDRQQAGTAAAAMAAGARRPC
jgi:stage III sporulation protein AA